MLDDLVEPLIRTFGVHYVVGTWLFIPSILALGLLSTDIEHRGARVTALLLPYLIWPASLWMLKAIYDVVPMIRVLFGVDLTDLSIFGFLVILIHGYLIEVTEALTGGLRS
ncbi:hypothetical protein [Halorarum salinum]|uniref:Uncharacterized protein n=1 Tax=Halorarum salinum TaxID=2743089 RepID=A0A7D5L8B3_9EURY|nr:hypothetical protein [Halobaculum salinum]QLG60272.1 hypothetical protein HUG12_00215 [Halobaculum salinum]